MRDRTPTIAATALTAAGLVLVAWQEMLSFDPATVLAAALLGLFTFTTVVMPKPRRGGAR